MLLAVLSASMLRPVELSRMVSRSPSSVTGLCSGAGIPPAGTHAHTYTHTQCSGHHRRSAKSLAHIPDWVRARVNTRRQSDAEKWRRTTPAMHKHTPTHAIWPKQEKDCQCFMSMTVQMNAIWS